jgi:hypothetical protein
MAIGDRFREKYKSGDTPRDFDRPDFMSGLDYVCKLPKKDPR